MRNKLTQKDIRDILRMFFQKELIKTEIARRKHVHYSTVIYCLKHYAIEKGVIVRTIPIKKRTSFAVSRSRGEFGKTYEDYLEEDARLRRQRQLECPHRVQMKVCRCKECGYLVEESIVQL